MASLSGLRISAAMSCGVGQRCGLDPELLWCKTAAAAPMQPLTWEPHYAVGADKKKKKEKKTKKKKKKEKRKKTAN